MASTSVDAIREYRTALLARAESLQHMAEDAAHRAAWLERCGGNPADVGWLRNRADRLHAQTLALVEQFDEMCRDREPA